MNPGRSRLQRITSARASLGIAYVLTATFVGLVRQSLLMCRARRCCLVRSAVASLLAAVAWFVSPLALAQPGAAAGSGAETEESTETAEARAQRSFDRGLELQRLGQLEAACELFEASTELAPLPHAWLQWGNCRERRDAVGALHSFEAALAAAARVEVAVEREAYEAAARQRIEPLLRRVPTITFRPSSTPGASVVIAPASASSGVAVTVFDQPQRFNPGSYGVRVSAPGRALYLTNVDLAVGQHLELVLPALEEIPSVGSPPVPPRGRASSGSGAGARPAGDEAEALRFGPLPVALASGGAALLLTSVVTGLRSSSAREELERECEGPSAVTGLRPCRESLAGTKRRMEDYALATDVLWVTGALLAGVGVTLFVLDQSEPEAAWLGAGCSADRCGLSARGRF